MCIYIYIHIYKHICAQCCCFLLIFWQTWQNKWKAVRPQTCMRIELCSSFLVCSTCTSHEILIYNHIWSVVGNFEQWESSLSRRSAILRLATAIPSWQDSLFLADTGLPGPTHNQPGRQHVWCVEAKLLWLVELPHKASAFWQTCQAWPRPQWQQCWIYHTSIWQTSPASPSHHLPLWEGTDSVWRRQEKPLDKCPMSAMPFPWPCCGRLTQCHNLWRHERIICLLSSPHSYNDTCHVHWSNVGCDLAQTSPTTAPAPTSEEWGTH